MHLPDGVCKPAIYWSVLFYE